MTRLEKLARTNYTLVKEDHKVSSVVCPVPNAVNNDAGLGLGDTYVRAGRTSEVRQVLISLMHKFAHQYVPPDPRFDELLQRGEVLTEYGTIIAHISQKTRSFKSVRPVRFKARLNNVVHGLGRDHY